MLIGLGAIVGLGAVLVGDTGGLITHVVGTEGIAGHPRADQALGVVGAALVVAAGLELAYSLFTEGPDEAIEPLLLAMSAAILLQLAKVTRFDYREAIAAAL